MAFGLRRLSTITLLKKYLPNHRALGAFPTPFALSGKPVDRQIVLVGELGAEVEAEQKSHTLSWCLDHTRLQEQLLEAKKRVQFLETYKYFDSPP